MTRVHQDRLLLCMIVAAIFGMVCALYAPEVYA